MEKNISARKSSKTRPNQLKQRKITDLDKKLALKESNTYPVLPKSLHHNLGFSPLKEKAPFFLASIESSSSNRLAWQQTETSLHLVEDLYSSSVSCVHALSKNNMIHFGSSVDQACISQSSPTCKSCPCCY